MVLDILEKNIKDIADWDVPKGGFYIWVRFKTNLPMRKFFEEAVKHNVLINPGYVYDDKNSSSIRISFSFAPINEIEAGIKILSNIARILAKG